MYFKPRVSSTVLFIFFVGPKQILRQAQDRLPKRKGPFSKVLIDGFPENHQPPLWKANRQQIFSLSRGFSRLHWRKRGIPTTYSNI